MLIAALREASRTSMPSRLAHFAWLSLYRWRDCFARTMLSFMDGDDAWGSGLRHEMFDGYVMATAIHIYEIAGQEVDCLT